MNTPFDLANLGNEQIVYVRPVLVSELPQEMQDQAGDMTEVYALHSPNGERLALVKDRTLAFAIARQNDLTPVTVH